ncbi:MAG TPA: ABC transporter ATP-binding protein [Armatimonadota bacterium]|jgi:putative ABC transport system ATP-binding protein
MLVLEAFDLYRFYHIGDDETLALRGVSLRVEAGETVAVRGPSGSGKSTLLSCLAGLDEPDGGYVLLSGRRLTRRSETERAARRAREIGLMLQAGNLFDHLSVEDNLRLPMHLAGRVDAHRVAELLDLVGLSSRRHAYPRHISGGESARAAIAVALATSPALLLADEPTGEVDAESEERILQLFATFCSGGGAAVIATHSPAIAARASRVVRLLDGRVVEDV